MDELDEFLYGGEEAAATSTQNSTPAVPPAGGLPAESAGVAAVSASAASVDPTRDKDGSDDDNDNDDSSDEDNIEIVLDGDDDEDASSGGKGADVGEDGQLTGKSAEARTSAMQLKPTLQQGDQKKDGAGDGIGETMDEVIPLRGLVNINGIGDLNGQSVLDYDMDSGEEKQWRKPGADITDFFNYGFNESTWRAYCMKQKQMREEFGIVSKRSHHIIDDRLRDRDAPVPMPGRGGEMSGRGGYRGGEGRPGSRHDAPYGGSRGGRQRDYGGRPRDYGGRPPREYERDYTDSRGRYDEGVRPAAGPYDHERRDKRRRDGSADSYGRSRRSRDASRHR